MADFISGLLLYWLHSWIWSWEFRMGDGDISRRLQRKFLRHYRGSHSKSLYHQPELEIWLQHVWSWPSYAESWDRAITRSIHWSSIAGFEPASGDLPNSMSFGKASTILMAKLELQHKDPVQETAGGWAALIIRLFGAAMMYVYIIPITHDG